MKKSKLKIILIVLLVLIFVVVAIFLVPLPWKFYSQGGSSINYDIDENGQMTKESLEFECNEDCFAYKIVIGSRCRKGNMKFNIVYSTDETEDNIDSYSTNTNYKYEKVIYPSQMSTKTGVLYVDCNYITDGKNSFSCRIENSSTVWQLFRKWRRDKIQEKQEEKGEKKISLYR